MQFLEVVREVVEHSDEMVAMLQRRYARTNPHFLWNRDFISTVKECKRQMLSSKDKSYIYLSDFNQTLKVNLVNADLQKFVCFIYGW